MFSDKEMRAQEFALLGRLITSVPVRRLRPNEDPSQIDKLCALVSEAYGTLNGRFSPSSDQS